jgi:hypothetical protein
MGDSNICERRSPFSTFFPCFLGLVELTEKKIKVKHCFDTPLKRLLTLFSIHTTTKHCDIIVTLQCFENIKFCLQFPKKHILSTMTAIKYYWSLRLYLAPQICVV